jgi:hypothetical protein
VRVLACVILTMAATSALAAEVYRFVEPDGTVVYTDRPSSTDAVQIMLATRRPVPVAQATNSQATPPPAIPAGVQAAGDQRPTRAERARAAAERERNCEIARQRAESYNTSHRLYRALPNGEREYLNDAEIDEARSQAESDVANWCD